MTIGVPFTHGDHAEAAARIRDRLSGELGPPAREPDNATPALLWIEDVARLTGLKIASIRVMTSQSRRRLDAGTWTVHHFPVPVAYADRTVGVAESVRWKSGKRKVKDSPQWDPAQIAVYLENRRPAHWSAEAGAKGAASRWGTGTEEGPS